MVVVLSHYLGMVCFIAKNYSISLMLFNFSTLESIYEHYHLSILEYSSYQKNYFKYQSIKYPINSSLNKRKYFSYINTVADIYFVTQHHVSRWASVWFCFLSCSKVHSKTSHVSSWIKSQEAGNSMGHNAFSYPPWPS